MLLFEMQQKIDDEYMKKLDKLVEYTRVVNRTAEYLGVELPDGKKQMLIWNLIEGEHDKR